MSATFVRGTMVGRGDLDLFTVDNSNQPINVFEISYAIYDATTGIDVLIGSDARTPINPDVGEYYAALEIPANARTGLYRIRWRFRETALSPDVIIMEEFSVLENETVNPLSLYSPIVIDMVRRLRILLRDNSPDRNYRFRPPTHEDTINRFNRVFGYIWEDYELVEYMERGVDFVNLYPPETQFNTIDIMVQAKPAWRQMILMAAMAHALMALSINWVSEEFSYSIGGISLDISKSSQYESLKGNAEQQLDKMLEAKTRTVKIMRGLKQSRYGLGVRSAFGPSLSGGVVSPRKYIGV